MAANKTSNLGQKLNFNSCRIAFSDPSASSLYRAGFKCPHKFLKHT